MRGSAWGLWVRSGVAYFGGRHVSNALARRIVVSLLAVSAVTFLPACSERLPTYRYRMTVEVETPEGLRTASSVIEVRTIRGSGFPGPEAAGISSRAIGEAVAVDLGRRGTLFALLRGPPELDWALDYAQGIAPAVLLPGLVDRSGTPEAWGNNLGALKEVRGSVALRADQYPLLVRFRDIANPRTVERVNVDDLAAAFGEGVRLRRISVEITEDPVTEGIIRHLPWWHEFAETQLDGDRLVRSAELANNLNQLAFKRGNQ